MFTTLFTRLVGRVRRRCVPEGDAKVIAWDFARPLGSPERRGARRGAIAWDLARPFEFFWPGGRAVC